MTSTSVFKRLRLRVLKDAGYRCAYCQGPANQVDHITAISQGGEAYATHNCAASCATCNARKGARATETPHR